MHPIFSLGLHATSQLAPFQKGIILASTQAIAEHQRRVWHCYIWYWNGPHGLFDYTRQSGSEGVMKGKGQESQSYPRDLTRAHSCILVSTVHTRKSGSVGDRAIPLKNFPSRALRGNNGFQDLTDTDIVIGINQTSCRGHRQVWSPTLPSRDCTPNTLVYAHLLWTP